MIPKLINIRIFLLFYSILIFTLLLISCKVREKEYWLPENTKGAYAVVFDVMSADAVKNINDSIVYYIDSTHILYVNDNIEYGDFHMNFCVNSDSEIQHEIYFEDPGSNPDQNELVVKFHRSGTFCKVVDNKIKKCVEHELFFIGHRNINSNKQVQLFEKKIQIILDSLISNDLIRYKTSPLIGG